MKLQMNVISSLSSLIELLQHPSIIMNSVAEDIYGSKGKPDIQRLRSRSIGRHRFTLDEYTILVRLVSKKYIPFLQKIAGQPEKLSTQKYPHWLNLKYLLTLAATASGQSYFLLYDRLRGRVKIKTEEYEQIALAFSTVANEFERLLKQAKVESKEYVFGTGRGGRNDKE